MNSQVVFHYEFEPEFAALEEGVQVELLAYGLLCVITAPAWVAQQLVR